MDIKKTIEPYYREKHGQPSKAGYGCQCDRSPEQQHNAESLFLNPMYISPAPGIREKINTQKPCFCFFINLLASVYNFIRKIIQIITDLLRMFTELGTYLSGKLIQAGTNVKG